MSLEPHTLWYLFIGTILVTLTSVRPLIKRFFITVPQVQLLFGILVGPVGLGLVALDWTKDAKLLEVISEVAVVISLYSAGVKMREPLRSYVWTVPLILASASMTLSIAFFAIVGHFAFGLTWPSAILLGAILAPTDPVLADEVQVEHSEDKHPLRQALTGEAGFNDGTAFPFVLLAVGLSDSTLHELGVGLWKWGAVDLVWKIGAALVLGWVCGCLLGKLTVWFRQKFTQESPGIDELRSLGFIAGVYGAALAVNSYAFLAVFAAAVALRQVEISAEQQSDTDADAADNLLEEQSEVATALEQIVQVVLVVVVGILISSAPPIGWPHWLFAVLAIFVVRPSAVFLTLHTEALSSRDKKFAAWFGIRGIGTVFYLAHAIVLGVSDSLGHEVATLSSFAVSTIALSILLHGSTVAYFARRTNAV